MLEIKRISTKHEHYSYLENLMQTAFPLEERRNNYLQREFTDNHPLFICNLISNQENPVGLITYWDLDTFYYIEHFAIDSQIRNMGYGKRTLSLLKGFLHKPIVLEVEVPNDELTRKRISFYQSQGFHLHDSFPYLQPPYREEDNWLPLKLMSYGKEYTIEELEKCKDKIHQNVYGV